MIKFTLVGLYSITSRAPLGRKSGGTAPTLRKERGDAYGLA